MFTTLERLVTISVACVHSVGSLQRPVGDGAGSVGEGVGRSVGLLVRRVGGRRNRVVVDPARRPVEPPREEEE